MSAIPWTLLISMGQQIGPDVVAEVKRLYASWKLNGTEPTPADWDAVLLRVTNTSLQQMLEAEIQRVAAP